MKKILLLFSLTILIGCSQFSSRKDYSQKISFESPLSKGKYNFTLVSLPYPKLYNDKIKFYNDLNKTLLELNEIQKNSINLVMSKEIQNDFNAILTNGWFDKEILGMKIVEDLNENDKKTLEKLSILTPTNAGDIQKLLNQQYYILLKLTQNENMYNPEFLYTELDKSLLMQNVLTNRKLTIESLSKLQNNFVYLEESNNKNKPLYLPFNNSNEVLFNNPVIFKNSNDNSGFKVLQNSLVLFVGMNKDILSTKDFSFTSNLVNIQSLDELKSVSKNSNSVSNLLNWKRRKSNNNNKIDSLNNKFSNWEVE